MKESKLIAMQNQVAALTQTVRQLVTDFIKLDDISRGTLTAFQLHLGEEEWDKLIEELKDREKRNVEQDKKLDLDVE
mgnify:FL=1